MQVLTWACKPDNVSTKPFGSFEDFYMVPSEVDKIYCEQIDEMQIENSATDETQLLLSKIEMTSRLHEKELEFKDRQIAQKEAKLKELTLRIQHFEREKNSKVVDLTAKLTQKEQQLDVVNAENSELKEAVAQYKVNEVRSSEDLKCLTSALEESEKQHCLSKEQLSKELEEAHQKIELLETRKETDRKPENDNKRLEVELNRTRQALSARERELQEIVAKKNALEQTVKQLQIQKGKAERDADWSRKHNQAQLNEVKNSLKKKTVELETLHTEMNNAVHELEKEKQGLQEEIQRVSLELDGKELCLVAAQDQLQQAKKELKSVQNKRHKK